MPILGITAHFISTKSWELRELLLEMIEVEGSHSGENVAAYLLTCLSDFNIQESLFCITADNASSDATMGRAIEMAISFFSTSDNMLGRIGHIMNLAAQKSIKSLNKQPDTERQLGVPADMRKNLE